MAPKLNGGMLAFMKKYNKPPVSSMAWANKPKNTMASRAKAAAAKKAAKQEEKFIKLHVIKNSNIKRYEKRAKTLAPFGFLENKIRNNKLKTLSPTSQMNAMTKRLNEIMNEVRNRQHKY